MSSSRTTIRHRHTYATAVVLVAIAVFLGNGTNDRGSEQSRDRLCERMCDRLCERAIADREYATVAHFVSRESFDKLGPTHRQMVLNIAAGGDQAIPVAACLEAGDEPDFNLAQVMEAALGTGFNATWRWSVTATNGPTGLPGNPVTLRYSFMPDGTSISGGVGEPTSPSNLFAVMNNLYGTSAVWQAHFTAMFNRWSELSGITYVFEPNDDGAATSAGLAGVIGVRGDIRVGGHFIDGQSGSNILAYNSYPNFGDMVIDTSNTTFFGNQFSNALALRNTASHEHGHGLGLAHVCPMNSSKLMEPFISTSYDGPQHDDIQGVQKNYGDRFENNDTLATARDFGALPNGLLTHTNLSCDSNSDVDWYKFTVPGNKTITATVTPVGSTYMQGPQAGTCSAGTSYNSLAANDLGIAIHDSAGAALVTASVNPAGVAESIVGFVLSQAGTYEVRVFPGTTGLIQIYRLDVTISDSSTASVSSTGTGCGASAPPPLLTSTIPVLGTTINLTVSHVTPSATSGLLASVGTWPPTVLGGGCTAYLNLAGLIGLGTYPTTAAGTATIPLALPQQPSLVGLDVGLQVVVVPSSGPLGLDITNGVQLHLGY
jgi:hypothetical protein